MYQLNAPYESALPWNFPENGGMQSPLPSETIPTAFPPGDSIVASNGGWGAGFGSPLLGGFGSFSISGIVQQIFALAQQLTQALTGSTGTPQPENTFSNATAASTGDPHLSFSGTEANGQTDQQRFDSMVGHNDLLNSHSFFGGYRISTTTTPPNANGVTYNASATVTTNFGNTKISLDNGGNATVLQNGVATPISAGQTLTVGTGESVTRNPDGSLSISATNASGANLTTTLRVNGPGVDVTTEAQNCELGGDLVNGNAYPQPPIYSMPPYARQAL